MSVRVRPETPGDAGVVAAVVTAVRPAFTGAGARPGPEVAFVHELRLEPGAYLAR